MKIRDAKLDELDFIREQRVAAYAEHSAAIPAAHWQALRQAISSEAERQDGVELIVCELDEKIVGSVVLFPAKTDAYEGKVEELDYPEIRMLAVTPENRGKGIASALIAECIRRSKAKNHKFIGLHTGEFMKQAIQLYTKHGFEHLPQYDFVPADDGIVVKAFRLGI
ncbi:GNAT family N-acetyltransferase [Lederbergia panacisoli]|uniref:GNAT family N-acetyltransferase n=1 Tax=Lederbergia panacisoli TaxID=1255251 RepID=UPI00214CFA0C|nr:GNAT family N-acetyltransferase [Lederbergia panacisoli]MCR2822215.1 GNAT family N-acetyltransferase [Lederbergia panacisoli]